MMKNRTVWLCAAVALLALWGCKTPVTEQHVETLPEVDKPLKQYIETDTLDAYEYFTAHFSAEVRGLNANGVLRIKRDSIIWLTATKLIEVGRAKFTRDSIYGLLRVGNRYVACSYDDLREHLGMDMNFATLQGVLTGHGSNRNLIQVEYADFDTIRGEEFPRLLEVTLNDKRYYTTAQLRYTKIVLDQPADFPFTIPKNATPLW